jgi:hypothetical protein
MAATDIQPLEKAYREMRDRTRPTVPVRDDRGPLVYELTEEASLNGIDPNCKDKPGGCVHTPRG